MVTKYEVKYKPNPKYKGGYQGPTEPGLQGRFGSLEKAEAAADSCKRYFNTEKYLEEVPHSDGKVTTEAKTRQHDNVIVWIETYEDGVLQEADKELVIA